MSQSRRVAKLAVLAGGIRLFHRTTGENAAQILAEGFRDAEDYYMVDHLYRGVWLSDRPLDANGGARGDVLLEVLLRKAEAEIDLWEWKEEGKPYREWLIPADLVNANSTLRIIDEDEIR